MPKLKPAAGKALAIGSLCFVAYLAVYVARNLLSAVNPQLIEQLRFGTAEETTAFIGRISSVYFICYAVGQLINGAVGDRVKARYMISFGLGLAGITNLLFVVLADHPDAVLFVYGITGFFLAMIYGPMTKVVAENTELVYATRCSLGYTFASFLGSPLAGLLAAVMAWQNVFLTGSLFLFIMAIVAFTVFLYFEKHGIVKYGQYKPEKTKKGGSIRVLIKHRIITFTLISAITGIVRTTVVFWLPTYISQHLEYGADTSAALFTGATLVISLTSFIVVFIYERLRRNMDLTIRLMFGLSAVFFTAVYFVRIPVLNLVLMVLAVMASNGAATMLWSRYCPSLRDTGVISGATGFLDFVSYMAASVSSTFFADAISTIGWSNLILVWAGLVFSGLIIALPWRKLRDYAKGL